MKKRILIMILVLLTALPLCTQALASDVSSDQDNEYGIQTLSAASTQNYYYYWSSPVYSYMINDGTGYMSVEYTYSSKILVRYLSSSYATKSTKNINIELPLFGGFYAGKDSYYIVFGQNNLDENDSTEVIRVVKYDKNWNRLGSASLYGANTYIPFDAGSLRMAEYEDYLYILTCHEMYKTSDGYHHQANMRIQVDTSDMSIANAYYSISGGAGYSSHSFNQFILVDDNAKVIQLDHGDAYPRAAALVRYNADAGLNYARSGATAVNVISFAGDIGYNYTGATLGGLEYSSTHYLVAGSSIVQDGNNHSTRNIFLTATSRDDFSEDGTTFKWITSYPDGGNVSASNPHLVKLDTDSFLLVWATSNDSISYVRLDGKGNLLTSITTKKGSLSDCKPVVKDGLVSWYITDYNDKPTYYSIDTNGWYKLNDKWYYYKNGSNATGWIKDQGKWYYLNPDGVMKTGWLWLDKNWYRLGPDGAMLKGWYKVKEKWYYSDSSGEMQTGWVKVNGKWYYLDSDGVMQTGWLWLDKNWYRLGSNGAMLKGWYQVKDKWYYSNSSGVMQTGWVKVDKKWYYLDSDGVMQTGWLLLSGKWYYLKSNGQMASNETLTISGKRYKFNSSGVWVS